jgi:formylglycine-generating enzyme required for sulfatase activity
MNRAFSFAGVCFVLLAIAPAIGEDKKPSSQPAAGTAVRFAGTQLGQTRKDNVLGTTLGWIPAGKFTMGSPKDETGRHDNENQVQVTLSKGFWLGQHEVTQAEWQRVMGTTPWTARGFVKVGGNYPATYVKWDDAMSFCEELTEQERNAGRLPSGWQYSLPTEAQWEYACRAGTKSRYSFGDNESDLWDRAWFEKNAAQFAHEVGRKKANPWGLFDMHGNEWEWCRDCYAQELSGGMDPQGPSGGPNRVVRGGSWSTTAGSCRSANRNWDTPNDSIVNLGFRIAAVPSGK